MTARMRSSLWTNWHTFGTPPSQTRAPSACSVSAEGGGTTTPTLMGGGTLFSREQFLARRCRLDGVAR
jgi:hypothetical protein